ncbi:hypothetical protein Tco_0205912, partial [Tanacetum coccineum]
LGYKSREEDSSELRNNLKIVLLEWCWRRMVVVRVLELIVLGSQKLREPGLDPVPSIEALEMTVDSSGTPSMLPVPSFEPPVPGYLLLIFLLSLRAFIMSAASCSAGIQHMHQTCVSDLDVVWKHMHQRVNNIISCVSDLPPEAAADPESWLIMVFLLFADHYPGCDPVKGPSSSCLHLFIITVMLSLVVFNLDCNFLLHWHFIAIQCFHKSLVRHCEWSNQLEDVSYLSDELDQVLNGTFWVGCREEFIHPVLRVWSADDTCNFPEFVQVLVFLARDSGWFQTTNSSRRSMSVSKAFEDYALSE